MDLKRVNSSIVSVILDLKDYKNLFSRNHAFSLRFNGNTITNTTGIAFKFNNKIYVICDGNIFAPYSNSNSDLNKENIIIKFNQNKNLKSAKYNASIIFINHLNKFQNQIENMGTKFKFGYINHSNIHNHLTHKFGYIVLFSLNISNNSQLSSFNNILSYKSLLKHSFKPNIDNLMIGRSIFSISNPFGILCNNVLSNNVNHGTLSTVINNNNNECIWLSDMKYLPGMEGGCVIYNDNDNDLNYNHWIGIVSIPLIINNIILTTIISSDIIVSLLKKHLFLKYNSPNPSRLPLISQKQSSLLSSSVFNTLSVSPSTISSAISSVLPITIGSHWGSCILISSSGDILTSAHIVRPYLKNENEKDLNKRIEFKNNSFYESPKVRVRKWIKCKLIYVSYCDSPWDIAHLRAESINDIDSNNVSPIKLQCNSQNDMNMLYRNMFLNRDNVYVIGYGLIHPSHGLNPLICSGIISKVVYDDNGSDNDNVLILKTSSDIHGGHSGGLLCDTNGYCLGLLTNNSVFDFDTDNTVIDTLEKQKLWKSDKNKNNNSNNKKVSFVYPHLNSVIPFSILNDLYQCIIDKNNNKLENVLQLLDKPDIHIQAKWNLISPEKLNHELKYEKKMNYIMNTIPKQLLDAKNESKL